MYKLCLNNKFERDLKLCKKQGKDLTKLSTIVEKLRCGDNLSNYKDHSLRGNWKNRRELHIEPDWLLIYYIEDDTLYLVATGSHTYLFD